MAFVREILMTGYARVGIGRNHLLEVNVRIVVDPVSDDHQWLGLQLSSSLAVSPRAGLEAERNATK